MNLLFDEGLPKKLGQHLHPHPVRTIKQEGWGGLQNGELLNVAQQHFDVLITSDSNMKYQRDLGRYDIALIVLRAFKNTLEQFSPLVPEILETLETIQPGQAIYLYANDKLLQKDQRKGRPSGPNSASN